MSGWKTTTGAVLTALSTIFGMYNGNVSIVEGVQIIGAALSAIGLGHKLDKIKL
jgi:hypothetical protein